MLIPCLMAAAVVAGEARAPLHTRIDTLIASGYPGYAKAAAPLADDAEFLRRVYLDLTGTIPPVDEVRAFLADRSPGKRARVIEELLDSPGYVRRMGWFFDVTLMERRADAKVPRADWEAYLREAVAANRPYDELVREILSSDGTDAKTRPAAKFLLDRNLEPNLVTRDLARIFLGRNLTCAQCHDHPIIHDYTQAEYYGLQAFVSRSFLFPNATDAKGVIAEKADGDLNFVSVFDETKKQHTATPRIPGRDPIPDPPTAKGQEYKVAPAKDIRPVPAYSRRQQLAGAITSPRNPAFARTAVNRVWEMMLGRGLVNSPEWDHSGNPPSHPELLDLLTTAFVTHNHDVKWLVRQIALSDTYQRSSESPAALAETEQFPADRYLVATLKPLTPEQLAYALCEATGQHDAERAKVPKPGQKATNAVERSIDSAVAPRLGTFRGMFAAREGQSENDFSATLDQTLFLKYGGVVRGMTATRAARLAKLTDADAIAEQLVLGVLSRLPTADEKKEVVAWLSTSTERNATLAELTWALVASAEFRFNH